MKKRILYIIISTCIFAVIGCHDKPSQPEQTNPPQETHDSTANNAALKQAIDTTNEAYDKELIDKLKNSETPPPRIVTSVEVLESDHISVTDVERAWLFQQPSFERCYGIAITQDESTKGEAVVSLKRDQGAAPPEMTSLTTDILQDGFEACLNAAPLRWRLPEGSSATLRIKFSSLPGLTAKDLAELVPDHRHTDPVPAQNQDNAPAPAPEENAVPSQE